jgi:hypothetical protein|tara:strand:- start:71 stop:499 length:429 start_codon:yes stop_codon:yes gene_type:complete
LLSIKIIIVAVLSASNNKSFVSTFREEKLYPLALTIIIDGNNTNNIFIILLPITLPIPIAAFFFNAATIRVISSGRDVPRAKIVRPITVWAIPKFEKKTKDSDRNNLPPIKKPKKLNNNLIILTSVSILFSLSPCSVEKFFR